MKLRWQFLVALPMFILAIGHLISDAALVNRAGGALFWVLAGLLILVPGFWRVNGHYGLAAMGLAAILMGWGGLLVGMLLMLPAILVVVTKGWLNLRMKIISVAERKGAA